jgi:hypothetical protein
MVTYADDGTIVQAVDSLAFVLPDQKEWRGDQLTGRSYSARPGADGDQHPNEG